MKSKYEQFLDDPKRRVLYEAESLASDAAELVAELMEQQGVTKAQLATRIGKSKSHVTQLLSGGRNMTLRTFAELLFALGSKAEVSAVSLARPQERRVEAKGTRMSEFSVHSQLLSYLLVGERPIAGDPWSRALAYRSRSGRAFRRSVQPIDRIMERPQEGVEMVA